MGRLKNAIRIAAAILTGGATELSRATVEVVAEYAPVDSLTGALAREITGTNTNATTASTQADTGPDLTNATTKNPITAKRTIGNVNNKKGFSATSDATFGTAAYALTTRNSTTGVEIEIQTFYGTGGDLTQGVTFRPDIPYRIFLNDPKFVEDHLAARLVNQPSDGTNLLFNPGITKVGDTLTMPADFTAGNTNFIELNLTRSDFSSYKKTTHLAQAKDNNTLNIYVNDIHAYDTQASMQVKKSSSSPSTTDYIYLSVTARVDIYGNQSLNGEAADDFHYYWATPVVLQLEIDKSLIRTTGSAIRVTPNSWAYPLADDRRGASNKITSALSTDFTTEPWNYKVIPSKEYEIYNNSISLPTQYGCLTDITNVTDNWVGVHCSFGALYGDRFEQRSAMHTFEFSADNMVVPSNSKILDSVPSDGVYGTDVLCEFVSGVANHYVAIRSFATTLDTENKYRYMYLYILDANLDYKAYIQVNGAGDPDLIVNSGICHMKYVDVSDKTRYFKFPTIDATFTNAFGNFKKLSSTSANRHFSTYLTDEWVEGGTLTSTSKDFSSVYPITNMVLPYRYIDANEFSVIDHAFTPDTDNLHAFRTKDISKSKTEVVPTSYLQNQGVLNSMYNDGFAPNEHAFLKIEKDSISAHMYQPADFTLGKAVVEYWRDPFLGATTSSDGIDERDRSGVKLNINITGCYGVFSSAPLTTSSFDSNITPLLSEGEEGGIAINTTSRPDFDFKYAGNLQSYLALIDTWSGGYRAVISNPSLVTFTNADGENLLYGDKTEIEFNPQVWGYGTNGEFNLYVPLELDLTNAGAAVPFTDPTFQLLDCELGIKLKDKNGQIIATKEFTVTIDPPTANGSITADGDIYKTISNNVEFNLVRESDTNASDYTEIHNIVGNTLALTRTSYTHKPTHPYSFKDNGRDTKTVSIDMSETNRGSYCWVSYEPMLGGVKPAYGSNNGVAHSNYVTNCLGARYNLDNTELRAGLSGVYSDDFMNSIRRQNPYFYVSVGDDSADIKVTTDIGHETWVGNYANASRGEYTDINIYPGISGIYIAAAKISSSPDDPDFLKNFELDVFDVFDNALTYPNVKISNNQIKRLAILGETLPGVFASGILFDPTVAASKTSQDMIINITEPGNYRVFLSVEDEFEQFSNWCITNPTTFNFPL